MKTTQKLMAGGVGLLLCTGVYAGFSTINAELRQADFESVARLYFSADPRALVTVSADPRALPSPERPPALDYDERLAVYIDLHKTRFETPAEGMPVFAQAVPR